MTTTDATPAERNYPLPQPENDPRFTFGLLYEVGRTIEAHGYPPLTGRDVVELMQALFQVLYAPDPADADADLTDYAAIERGAEIDRAVEATGHLPGYADADGAADETRWIDPFFGPCPHCPCPTGAHSVGLGCVLCDCTWGREAQR